MPKVRVKKSKEKINPRKIVEERKNLMQQLTEEVEEQGVQFFSPEINLNIETDMLVLPPDITEVASHNLGKHLNAFTQQRMYMRTVLSWQKIAVEQRKREYEEISTPFYQEVSQNNKYKSEAARNRYVQSHPAVMEVYYSYMNEVSKEGLIESNIESLDDGIFLISREISRREKDFENEQRLENIR